jgi:hypothetical protein
VPEFANHPGAANRVAPVDGATALAGYTTTPGVPEMAALVLGNDGRTLLRAFQDGGLLAGGVPAAGNHADRNDNGIPDGVELWVNSIVEVGGYPVRPWLTATGSGDVRPGREAELAVSVDARQLAPGSFSGTVTVVTDAARESRLVVPVALTVTEPAVECDRTVTGTHAGPLVVTSGVTCLAAGARVVGPIAVRGGAGLVAIGALWPPLSRHVRSSPGWWPGHRSSRPGYARAGSRRGAGTEVGFRAPHSLLRSRQRRSRPARGTGCSPCLPPSSATVPSPTTSRSP